MKVLVERKKEEIDCRVGDVIVFDNQICMIVDMGEDSPYYGLMLLEGADAGVIISEKVDSLYELDEDERTTEILIKKADVVVSKGE